MTEQHGSQWRPIADLEPLGRQIEELLAAISAQHEALRLSGQEAANFDVYSISRITALLTVQRDDLWRFDEQLRRWLSTELTDAQRLEVQRLNGQMVQLYNVIDATLQLAGQLK